MTRKKIGKPVVIKRRIEEIMQQEFQRIIKEAKRDPLLRLVIDRELSEYYDRPDELTKLLKRGEKS